jgi:hypothetical protein
MTAAGIGQGYAAIHDAVARLAGVCDFAETQDGQGFNATDTWLGHVLAAMPAEDWTWDEALAAWDMLRKYRGQLDGFEISYDDLPRPQGADDLEAARREEARERARQRGRQWREQQYRKAHSYVRCDGAGEKVTLAFPFDPVMVDAAKAIKGRYFDWDTKTNVYPFTSLPQIVAFAEGHGIDVATEVRALVPTAAAQVQREATRPNVHTDQAGQVVISAEFNPRLNDALKKLNGGRSTWDPRARVHRPPIHRDPGRVLAVAEEFGLTVGDDARAAIEAETTRHDRNQAAATAFEADPVPVPGLAPGTELKPQQYPVVRFALEHRQLLIGDDMGWGKTLSSLAAVAADGAFPAVVVCRPSLTLNWSAEIGRFFPGLTVHQAAGTTPEPVPDGADVIVIGSAALAARPRATKTGKEFGWVKALAAAEPKALIIDEGQDTKERAANRSQACEQLAASVIARNGLVLDLTGTAILNRPRELCQQLSILGRIGEFGGPKAFLWRYCLSETNEWGATYNGARNLAELHQRLLRWGIMIRRSDDAKLGLPPCREHVLRIPNADLDPDVMARYRQAEADLLGYLADQARQAAERLGADPVGAAVQAAMRAQAAEHLVAINTLRQLAGHAKRGYVTTWIRDQVATGEKVMVAAHHRGEVDHYAATFGGLKLQGGQPVADKEAAKAAFQQQPAAKAPVIAVAIGAGGVGHTLTAARIGVQAEQAWTPGETQQMKKRLHRIGQDRPVDYYITVAENTIDEQLREVVTAKQATLDVVLDGQADDGAADDENSVVAELAWRLTQQGLGRPDSHPDNADRDEQNPLAGDQPDAPMRDRAGTTDSDGVSPALGAMAHPPQELCPGCGTARLLPGRGLCQGCGVLVALGRLQVPGISGSGSSQASRVKPRKVQPPMSASRAEDAVSGASASPRWASTCVRCHAAPPGPGGILCPSCRAAIEARNPAPPSPPPAAGQCPECHQPRHAHAARCQAAAPREARSPSSAQDEGDDAPGDDRAGVLRATAHLYLGHGLHPVPGWAANANGKCCCPRGADCPRPGKHPRSVHVGPGRHDYSWKPLACDTGEQVGQRFAGDGPYAAANLMLAIPAGVLVIDQDNDDGGRQAVAELAGQLGNLPPTLTHRTPHGVHHIYRTPPGWTGRAWVGKDARNPLPAGIDLRVPGQILMAPPSQVPGPAGLVIYGPASGTHVADLPAAYLTAWTPPQIQAARPRQAAPVPPERADAAVSYVHARIGGILADLAACKPGGRNAAIYTAALKVGSTLGAARTTSGAAAGWTDEAAEDALMEAAERNGYIGKDGAAEARAAVRSGLRNGLRNPRPLPDLTSRPATRARRRRDTGADPRPGDERHPAVGPSATPDIQPRYASAQADQERPVVTGQAVRRAAPTVRSVSAVLGTAGFVASSRGRDVGYGPEGYRVQAAPDGGILIRHVAIGDDINGVTPSARIEQMLTRYDHTLRAAGFNVTNPTSGSLAVTPAGTDPQAAQTPAPASRVESKETQASRVAITANEAYRTGDFDRARQLIDQAAELDPSQAELWRQHRTEIAARKLFTQARDAAVQGDRPRADKLFEDARQLDTRMRMLWNHDLTGIHTGQQVHQSPSTAMGGHGQGSATQNPSHERPAGRRAGQQWPGRSAPGHGPQARGTSETHRLQEPSRTDPGASKAPGTEEAPQQSAGHRGGNREAEPGPDLDRQARPALVARASAREQSPSAASAGLRLGDRSPSALREPETEAYDWRDALIEAERRQWQPKATLAGEAHPKAPEVQVPEIGA